ncbi:hypothetical protein BDP27DRAFT_1321230, partial [Rhodocollybia butyracea]
AKLQPEDDEFTLKKKRSKAAVKRTGKLSLLPSLPLDILYEVLMRKNATTTWKAAFARIPELPECPADMSHPAWAHLAFEHICHNCSAINIHNMSWVLRTRLCTKCAKTCLETVAIFDAVKTQLNEDILTAVAFDAEYLGHECCLVADRKSFEEEWKLHQDDREEFVTKRGDELIKRVDHALECEEWASGLASERAMKLQQIRDDRRCANRFFDGEHVDDVVRSEYVPFRKLAVVRQPKPLRESTWDSIKDELEAYMLTVRAYIKKRDREGLIWARRKTAANAWHEYRIKNCDAQELLPNQIDIWLWRPVIKIISQPSEVEVTQTSFDAVFRGLPAFIKFWQEDKMDQLLRIASHPKWITSPGVDDLQLATCVFSCCQGFNHLRFDKKCTEHGESEYPMFYPEFIAHPCNVLTWLGLGGDEDEMKGLDDCEDVRAFHECKNFRRRRWTTRLLEFDPKASRTVKNILDACGLPATTTVPRLDDLNPRIVCLKCSYGAKCDGEREHRVMTWRTAVQHNLRKHFGDSQTTFQKISPLDAHQATRLEQAERILQLSAHRKPKAKPWRCIVCKDRPSDPGALTVIGMQKHWTDSHAFAGDVEEEKQYYRAYDQPPPQPISVRMKPRDPGVN